jgi:uncharacterized membrane protein YkvA (DUF1232 family)
MKDTDTMENTAISKNTAMKNLAEIDNWSENYSEPGLWDKVKNSSRRLGRRPIELGLTLFYTLQSPRTPVWCKAVISGSLGYFISLVDALPDLTPVLGYTDDVAVMTAALAMLGAHVTPEARARAKRKTDSLIRDPEVDQRAER